MPEKILVIKLSALGDFIIAFGAMEAIRKAHPGAQITLLTTPLFKDMATRSQYFDAVWAEKRPVWNDWKGWWSLYRRLNAAGFSRVYDLQMNDRTRIYYHLFRRKPLWSGVIPGSPLYYDNPDYKKLHAFRRHQEILKVADIEAHLPDVGWMQSDISLIRPAKPYVLLIPGCAPQHPQKRWPALSYGALARKLRQHGYAVAALGTQAETEAIATIKTACPEVIDLSGKTSFYDIASLAREAAGAVGNDTGPTHLASVAGCPVTVLFSSASNPVLSAPVGPSVQVLQRDSLADLSCEEVWARLEPQLRAP